MARNTSNFAVVRAAIMPLVMAGLAGLLFAARPGQSPQPAPESRISPKAQDLLNHALQALGGAAFQNLKTVTTSGRAFAFQEGETAGLEPYQSTIELPDKRRFSYGKSKPVVLINSGSQAWEIDQFGIEPQPSEDVKAWKLASRYSLENLFRLRIHEPGVLIQDSGVDFVTNQAVYVLDMVDSQQVHMKLYLHRPTYLPLRVTYRIANPKTSDWDDYADEYSDYQVVQGITTPMHVVRFLNDDRIGEVFRNTVRYNEPVPPNYFEPHR